MSLDRVGAELGGFLSHLVRRQETIASNIANADTPGYRTLDVSAPGNFPELLAGFKGATVEVQGLAGRNDGNNVSMDREARMLSENTLRFSLASQMLRGELKSIRSAIQEGKNG
jgi:flagellar basal-body rod protein FlgB